MDRERTCRILMKAEDRELKLSFYEQLPNLNCRTELLWDGQPWSGPWVKEAATASRSSRHAGSRARLLWSEPVKSVPQAPPLFPSGSVLNQSLTLGLPKGRPSSASGTPGKWEPSLCTLDGFTKSVERSTRQYLPQCFWPTSPLPTGIVKNKAYFPPICSPVCPRICPSSTHPYIHPSIRCLHFWYFIFIGFRIIKKIRVF